MIVIDNTRLYRLMHLLCLREKKVKITYKNSLYWLDSNEGKCLLCSKELRWSDPDLKEHALNHIKEYNLLPFI